MREWVVTGICPECKKKAVTVGRCVQCGWESERVNLEQRIAAVVESGRRRMNECEDPQILGLRPTEVDWLTKEELTLMSGLQLQLVPHLDTKPEILARLARKRKERKEKVEA